jgi:histidyl-tRNA synthetase
MDELKVFPEQLANSTKAMIVNFGGANEEYALQVLQQLRAAHVVAELYPDAAKFDKQMKYANRRGINYVIMPGDEERGKQMVSVKNFVTGEQQMVGMEALVEMLG